MAVAFSGIEGEDSSPRVQLLIDLQNLFAERNTNHLTSKTICTALALLEDKPWPEYSRGAPITPTQLAKLLKPFGVRPKTIRIEADTKKGYRLTDLAEHFERYIPPQ